MQRSTRLVLVFAPVLALAPQPEAKPAKGEAVRVLFIGNSLTAGNDLPGFVRAMADAGAVRMECESCTLPGASLEDQWNDGRSRRLLAAGKWNFVVLQQGPSTLPESQAHLRLWSVRWANEARKRGARTALFMVWPTQGQRNGFELVARSYRAAARASGALLLPAGEAWRDASKDRAAPPLYLPDRLHPTPAGTYLAALVITGRLAGVRPGAVGPRVTLGPGRVLELPDDQARRLTQAAEKVLREETPAAGKG
jgi:hypothetical protein